jgi:uncharacterized GH25 family protein
MTRFTTHQETCMFRTTFALALAGLMAAVAQAHFVFVVPAQNGATATVVFSEDLNPDEAVAVTKVAGLKLTVRDAGGKEAPVAHKAEKHSLVAALPGSGPRVVYGSVAYGVLQKGDSRPYLLNYHPKAVVGAVPADRLAVGDKLPAEIVPVAAGSTVKFKLVAGGKPVVGAEVTVIKPDGTTAKLKTGPDGATGAVAGSGRFGAWARYAEAKAGEHAGKKYEEVRHYPTLVFDTAK